MKSQQWGPVVIFWFRRDLRLDDNVALYNALKEGSTIIPVFIFDTEILGKLEDAKDRRVIFIHREVAALKARLEKEFGSTLFSFHGSPVTVMQTLIDTYQPAAVYANEDYEPYAINRDEKVSAVLKKHGSRLVLMKDQVLFAKNEIVKSDGTPYTVFTPYSKRWLQKMQEDGIPVVKAPAKDAAFVKTTPASLPLLADLGVQDDPHFAAPPRSMTGTQLKEYENVRNIPAIDGTSHLGIHLRFGTISVRKLIAQAEAASAVFLNELIWREFFQQILWHFPDVVHASFKPKYDEIPWRNNEKEFAAWCAGRTGYPLVDAGMRELNATGFMHNRVRMVTASFLTKHLLIDWRWGEAYFAQKLLDYELASNNGNWQWAAGTGCDAAPYFRIFNPAEQARKFDPDGKYIRKWIREFDTPSYPVPVVEHKAARERALKVFSRTLTDAR